MLYCTSTVAFGATSLKGGLFFSNPWREAIEERYTDPMFETGTMFPILGGRLLKGGWQRFCHRRNMFPILGGRLLKKGMGHCESYEETFPILGGRLLKGGWQRFCHRRNMFPILRGRLLKWLFIFKKEILEKFPILRGRLLKLYTK